MSRIKFRFFVGVFQLLLSIAAAGAPAFTKARTIRQADGSLLTLIAHGDERCHFLTTTDGYTVIKGNDGNYYYADIIDGVLAPSDVIANDENKRSNNESLFLINKKKYLAPSVNKSLRQIQGGKSIFRKHFLNKSASGKNYRGLVLLVDFNDRGFSRDDETTHRYYDDIMNKENLTTIYDTEKKTYLHYTGSVRDYFNDNSYGRFIPDFDVVGPININCSQKFINGVDNTYELVENILDKVDDMVDFSRYDSDNDGTVDMIYIVYAGYSSSYQGNNEQYVWPHAASLIDPDDDSKNVYHDGMKIGRYACSAELYGWEEESSKDLDGIGVIVHEFSHVLGFQDHYDTSNGYQEHPNSWDIMAAGSYSDDINRTPCAYNAYERYAAGFMEPIDITNLDGNHISLESVELAEDACLLKSYQEHVSYMMENRQRNKWDKYLPGHGMLVWRIDSTNIEYWSQNLLNVTTRACFRLVRACGTQGSFLTGVVDTDFDSFPGTKGITKLTNDEDKANLLSYDYFPCPVILQNISEVNGVIEFDVVKDEEAENRPVNFTLPSIFKATGELLKADGEWESITWTVRTSMVGDKNVLLNFLPNVANIDDPNKDYQDGIYVEYSILDESSHTISINAQRVAKKTEFSAWMCNFTNVEQKGTGNISMTIGRYGVPCLNSPEDELGYCTMKPKAFMVTESGIIDRVAVFRNISYSAYGNNSTGIEQTPVSPTNNNDIIIYNLNGQKLSFPPKGSLYIQNGRLKMMR